MLAMILSRLTPLLVAALASVIVLMGIQTVRLSGVKAEMATQRTTFEVERSTAALRYAAGEAKARKTEQSLQAQVAIITKEKHEAIRNLDLRVAGLVERVRSERASRPAVVASTNSPGPVASPVASSTGAGLYAEDGEFLVREAASAAQIAIERDACYRQYNLARDTFIATQVTP